MSLNKNTATLEQVIEQLNLITKQVCCVDDIVDNFVAGDLPLIVGTSVVDSGTNGYLLYNNSGVLGELDPTTLFGIDDILANGQSLTTNRDIDLDTNTLSLLSGTFIISAATLNYSSLNIPEGVAPTAPNDGDIWREDNTSTGLKIQVGGVTKTITLA